MNDRPAIPTPFPEPRPPRPPVPPKPAVIVVEGRAVPVATVDSMMANIRGWFANCCGLAADTAFDVSSYGGLDSVRSVEGALAIRLAAFRLTTPFPASGRALGYGPYNSGYVLCSSTARQGVDEYLRGAGFKALDTFINPAHGSNSKVTIWGAPTINEQEVLAKQV